MKEDTNLLVEEAVKPVLERIDIRPGEKHEQSLQLANGQIVTVVLYGVSEKEGGVAITTHSNQRNEESGVSDKKEAKRRVLRNFIKDLGGDLILSDDFTPLDREELHER